MGRTETRTPAEITAQVISTLEVLRTLGYADQQIVEDYPIGRSDRGQCKCEVEFRPGHGTRLVRTTTNSRGRWNKPHKSQYSASVAIAVRDVCEVIPGTTGKQFDPDSRGIVTISGADFTGGKPFVGWVKISQTGIYLVRANYDSYCLVTAPNGGCEPQRTERRRPSHTVTMTNVLDRSDSHVTEIPEDVTPADSPELIAAYDAYMAAIKEVFAFVKAVKADIKSRAETLTA